jgi:hypothetical protein
MPRVEYAKNGDVHIAYQVFGQGPPELKGVPGEWQLYAVGRAV